MFFPVGDDQVENGYKPYVSYTLLTLSILVFMYQLTLPLDACSNFMRTFGSIPTEILAGQDFYTLFTNMFLHGGFMHIVGNMLFLWVFADNIEAIIGNVAFLFFYIAGGLAASAAHILFNMTSNIPTIGASGAIAAVLGAYIILFPKSQVRIRFLLFKPFKMTAILFLGIWFIQNLFSGLGSIGPASAQSGGVAWWAHIGGFVFGVVAGLIIKRSPKKNLV